ncbi:MAG: hypothetical protein PHE73_03710 [Sulfurovaceae bacterium]|nr:hypothetical protein [Sulfurovaceae bacterium]
MKKLYVVLLLPLWLIGDNVNEPSSNIQLNKIQSLDKLDKVLSPFEDLTEYSLEKDSKKVNEAFMTIKINSKNDITFRQSLDSTNYKKLLNDIKTLDKYHSQNNYKAMAILSTQIFANNIQNFKFSNMIKEQIHMEYLDYMGFMTLSLLEQDKIDYSKISSTVALSQKHWLAIRNKIKDKNVVGSFDLIYKGMNLSIKDKNNEMIKIFATMTLYMVDVGEKMI